LFHDFLIGSSSEKYQFSCLYPISWETTWKTAFNAYTSWWNINYNDASWKQIRGEEIQFYSNENSYFLRTSFEASISFSLIEISLIYQCSIVIYINGYQVFSNTLDESSITCFSHPQRRSVKLGSSIYVKGNNIIAIMYKGTSEALELTTPLIWLALYADRNQDECFYSYY
jgi:hypothetical protein